MSNYVVEALDENTGRKVRRTYQVASESEARTAALAERLHPYDVRVAIDARGRGVNGNNVRLSYNATRTINISLAVQIDCGSTTVNAVTSIHRANTDRSSQVVLLAVRESVRAGAKLSEALGQFPRIWTPDGCSMIRAAEDASPKQIARQIEEIVRYSDETEDLRKTMASKVFMPLVACVVGVFGMLVVSTFTLPRMGKFFKDMGCKELPLVTQWLIVFGGFLKEYALYISAGVGLVIVTIIVLWLRGKLMPLMWWVGRRVPILRSILRLQSFARFTSVFGVMTKATSNISGSLRYAAAAIPDPQIRAEVQIAVQNITSGGKDLVAQLRQTGHCDDAFLNCIAPDESRVMIPEICPKFVAAYLREIEFLGGRFGAMIELITLLMMVGGVLIMAYSIGAPMLQMYMQLSAKI